MIVKCTLSSSYLFSSLASYLEYGIVQQKCSLEQPQKQEQIKKINKYNTVLRHDKNCGRHGHDDYSINIVPCVMCSLLYVVCRDAIINTMPLHSQYGTIVIYLAVVPGLESWSTYYRHVRPYGTSRISLSAGVSTAGSAGHKL